MVADPPWQYGDSLPGPRRGATTHYRTLSLSDIALLGDLLQPELADDAHLYMWFTNAFVGDAHVLARNWGFEPKTVLTWVKVKKSAAAEYKDRSDLAPESEDIRIGMGWYYRNSTEHVLFATRGKLPPLVRNEHNVIIAERTTHSRKPAEFYQKVIRVSPGPRLELFAREKREGFTPWGDEAAVDD